MPVLSIDGMDDVSPWNALAPDEVTPSTALTRTNAPPVDGLAGQSIRLSASIAASGHLLRRTLGGLDLSNYSELRLWLRASRAASGSPAQPFFLELMLGSAALPLSDEANTWHRLLPLSLTDTWESVRLSLGDLPAPIRSAVTQMQLRCVDTSSPFTCDVDEVLAVQDEMLPDVEEALRLRLHHLLSLDNQPVPALLHAAGVDETATLPYILIRHHDVSFADQRTATSPERGDYTRSGYRLRPPSTGWDLIYKVDVVAADRPAQAKMLGAMLRALGAQGDLYVNGIPFPYELFTEPAVEHPGGARGDGVPLFYRLRARQFALAATDTPVVPVRDVSILTDAGAS